LNSWGLPELLVGTHRLQYSSTSENCKYKLLKHKNFTAKRIRKYQEEEALLESLPCQFHQAAQSQELLPASQDLSTAVNMAS